MAADKNNLFVNTSFSPYQFPVGLTVTLLQRGQSASPELAATLLPVVSVELQQSWNACSSRRVRTSWGLPLAGTHVVLVSTACPLGCISRSVVAIVVKRPGQHTHVPLEVFPGVSDLDLRSPSQSRSLGYSGSKLQDKYAIHSFVYTALVCQHTPDLSGFTFNTHTHSLTLSHTHTRLADILLKRHTHMRTLEWIQVGFTR